MEIRHLIYFKTLAEELHFGKAAQKLFISQPPLSRQIKDLEVELGAILFLRNNKQVILTDAGKYFLEQTDSLLQSLEHSKNITQQIHENVSGIFRLGYISSTPKSLLAKVLRQSQSQFPYLHVHLFELSSQLQKLSLQNGYLDIGIVRSPFFSENLETEPLTTEQLCIVASKDLELNEGNIRSANYICYNQEYAPDYYQLVKETCNKLGFEPNIVHQCNSMHSILALVAHNIGLAIVPISIVQASKDLNIHYHVIPKEIAITTTVLAYHPKNKKETLFHFIDFLRQSFHQ